MASFDLGALISGLSGGIGNYSQIQFAEQLMREKEQREFARKQQLAEQDFARR